MAGYASIFKELSTIAIYGTSILTILSGAQYIYLGTHILNAKEYQD
jgi:hypothetical protein